VRAVPQRWEVRVPEAVAPSPKSHRAEAGPGPPLPETTSIVTSWSTSGALLDSRMVTDAAGGGGALVGGGVDLAVGGFGAAGGVSGGRLSTVDGVAAGDAGADVPTVYLATSRTPPSRRITPARALSGSLKNTTPSRVSNWNRVPGGSIRGCATTRALSGSTTRTRPPA
jgi:hypothetical protein